MLVADTACDAMKLIKMETDEDGIWRWNIFMLFSMQIKILSVQNRYNGGKFKSKSLGNQNLFIFEYNWSSELLFSKWYFRDDHRE